MGEVESFIGSVPLAHVEDVVGVQGERTAGAVRELLNVLGTDEGPVDVPRLSEGVAQGAVVDSNVVTYPPGTPLEVRNAVSNWLLFAQRAASAQVPDRDDTEAWADAYLDVLLKTGWAQRDQASAWTEEGVLGSTVHQKILQMVTVVLGPVPTALAIVTAAITSLQSMNESSPWITLFDRRGKSATATGFQFANCEAGTAGGAALHAVDFRVHAEQTMTQVLFFKFTRQEARMFKRGVVLELSPDALAAYAPKITERVKDATLANIAAFDLAPVD